VVTSPFLSPIAPVRVPVPPSGRSYVHELKFDGFRGVACVGDGAQAVYSKNRHRFTRFDPLVAAIASKLSGQSAILDGEIVCLDADGRPDFAALMSRRGTPVFAAFNLLALGGQDLRAFCSKGNTGRAASFDTTARRCGTSRMYGAPAWTSSGPRARSISRASYRSRWRRRTSPNRVRGARR
jgi:hypothetical protein